MQWIRTLFLIPIFQLVLLNCISAQNNLTVELEETIAKGLSFIQNNQNKETKDGVRYAGEWPTFMCLQRGFVLLGKTRSLEDSNSFSVISIHNSLAQIYLEYPQYEQILPMLDLSFTQAMSYRNGFGFNFWNLLPPTRNLKRGVVPDPQPYIRRPTNFDLYSIYINNAANVVEDADDTALAFTAMALRNKILEKTTALDSRLHFATDSLGILLDGYRDHNRKNRHWFNVLSGNDHDTGAYLTWLGQEYKFKRWNFLFDLFHDLLFYLPFSECYPQPYVPYIPYGSNNIDAVVNSNIISALTINNITNAEGRKDAIKYLEKKSKKRKYRRVGSYYPNSYHFPYALSEAYSAGAEDLEICAAHMCKNLIRKQAKDGSWKSKRKLNNRDKVQSTAYALNALVNFGDYEDRGTRKTIEKAIQYLMTNSIEDSSGLRWDGGVFFSGGTVVRNNLIWKSDAFTTVLILKSYAKYLKYLQITQMKSKEEND